MADTTDAAASSVFNSNNNNSQTKWNTKPARGHIDISEYYDMNNKYRGVALILNHYEIKGQPNRDGTEVDCKCIAKQLEDLAFDVIIEHDLTLKELKFKLHQIAQMDHKDNDCLVVVVMTHGKKEDELFAKDKTYPVHTLWDPFVGDNCKSLIGKPKLFFVQACRGKKLDDGVLLPKLRMMAAVAHLEAVEEPPPEQVFVIPTMADFLVMYSTFEDHYSWRNPTNGSWFIQSLCMELEMNGKIRDILSILTGVIRRVAYMYQSNANEKKMNEKKQCPMLVSMLTKTLYFTPKLENKLD